MSFENERGGERHPDKEVASAKLAEDMAIFLAKPKTRVEPLDSTVVSTVAEVKAKNLLNVARILNNKAAKRPKVAGKKK